MLKQIPPVTRNLLIINLIVFMAQMVFEQRGYNLADTLGLHFVLAPDFAPWQLVSYMFLHGSFTHLFFNMFSLWMFGRIIEGVMGMKRFLIFYFVCGIGAGLCQELWQMGDYLLRGDALLMSNLSGPIPPVGTATYTTWLQDFKATPEYAVLMSEFLNHWTTIGASGACYGILLAFGMTFPNEKIMLLLPPIPLKAKYFVAGYAVIELLSAFGTNGNIAHFAHLGGMLFGLLLILYWRHHDRGGTRFRGWETWTPRRSRTLGERWRDGLRRFTRRKPKMEIREGGKRFKDREADYDFNRRQKEREERIDAILAKIKRSGYDSLSKEDKRYLFDNHKS